MNPRSGSSGDSSANPSEHDDRGGPLATVYLSIGLPDGTPSGGPMRGDLAEIQLALANAAREMTSAGYPVRYVNGMYMPAQARLLCVFCAETEECVFATVRLIGLPFVQIKAITDPGSL